MPMKIWKQNMIISHKPFAVVVINICEVDVLFNLHRFLNLHMKYFPYCKGLLIAGSELFIRRSSFDTPVQLLCCRRFFLKLYHVCFWLCCVLTKMSSTVVSRWLFLSHVYPCFMIGWLVRQDVDDVDKYEWMHPSQKALVKNRADANG